MRALVLSLVVGLLAGCASKVPWSYYLQREPVRVLIMPSSNSTDYPEAAIIFNQACEKALVKRGFEVISADKVVAYTSAHGWALRDVIGFEASRIGNDLRADMVLYSDIRTWESSYKVLNARVAVAGTSRLIETATDAAVWTYAWRLEKDSSGGNDSLLGMVVSAAVDVLANSMFDAMAGLGEQAAHSTVSTMPKPGYAPLRSRPKSIAH